MIYREGDVPRQIPLRSPDGGSSWHPSYGVVATANALVSTTSTTTIATPPAGKRILLRWVHCFAPEANGAELVVSVFVGATRVYRFGLTAPGVFQHGTAVPGGVGESVAIALSAALNVYVNIDYEVID